MNPPDSDFYTQLWRGSRSLREALLEEPSSPADARDAEMLMSTWAALVAGGSRTKLQARLSWDGITLPSAARRLAAVLHAPVPTPAAAWLNLVQQVLTEETNPAAWPAAFARRVAKDRFTSVPELLPRVEQFIASRLEEISEPALPAAQQPVLLRAMAEIAQNIVETVSEMLRRLSWDEKELSQRLADGKPLGKLTELTLGLSDPRSEQAQACRLRFDSGLVIHYKPWSLDIDQELHALIAWLRGQEGNCEWLPLSLRMVARDGYGWMPDVPPAAQLTPEFYRQYGGLLALLYALEARGFGTDNLVASSAGPIMTDAEAALQPLRGGANLPPGAEAEAEKKRLLTQATFTVLDTGLLPFPGPDAEQHLDDVQEGFRLGYTALLKHRAVLLGESKAGLSQRLEGRRGRTHLRPAAEYRRILRQLRSKPCLRSGLWRGCAAESFIAPWIQDAVNRPENWNIYRAELTALERWEVPCLPLQADACDLPQVVATPLEMAKRRLGLLSEADLARQQGLIEEALRPGGEDEAKISK